MPVVKWTYILTFELEEEMLNEEFLTKFDEEVLGEIKEVAEKYGVPYKLLPTPHILVKHLLRESEGNE